MPGLSTLAGSGPAAHAGTSAIARRRTIARAMLAATAIALLLAMLAASCIGAYRLTPAQFLAALFAPDASLQQARAVLLEIRAPRVVLAALVGIGFGTAGAAMQALFRNPLADPGLVGVSSGAALGAAGLIVLGPMLASTTIPAGWLPLAAFAGALAVPPWSIGSPPRAAGSRCRCCCWPASRSMHWPARRSACSPISPAMRNCAR